MLETRRYTYADYCKLPDEPRVELIDGVFCPMTPAPTGKHQIIIGNLYFRLRLHLQARGSGRVYLSPFDNILDDHNVVQPDVMLMLEERRHLVVEEGLRAAPDLVIEVLSPSTARRDRTVKHDLYFRFGAQEYWLVDPKKETMEVRRGSESRLYAGSEVLTTPLLPGLELPLAQVFSEDLD